MGDALDNLLKYGRFFLGGAQTPPPTVTSTPTPTVDLDRSGDRNRDAHAAPPR